MPIKHYTEIECYNDGEIKISFEEERKVYWLNIFGDRHLIEMEKYREISNLSGMILLSRLEMYNDMIRINVDKEGVDISKIEKAFSNSMRYLNPTKQFINPNSN